MPGEAVPSVGSARKSLIFSSLFPVRTFEKAPGAGDSAWTWLRTVSAPCVQSISVSYHSSQSCVRNKRLLSVARKTPVDWLPLTPMRIPKVWQQLCKTPC